MGKRGAVEAPELGMTGFSHILPAPRGMGTAYSDGFARQGASQVPIKTVNRIAYGDPADRGMLLQIWQICEGENERSRPHVPGRYSTTQADEGIPDRRLEYPPKSLGGAHER
jgi:hypothetical protein